MPCSDVPVYEFTDHARLELQRRRITEADIAFVLSDPEQREEVRPHRCVYQSRFAAGMPPKTDLLRVFVDTDRQPPEVVTAYLTSKVEKYWR